MKSRIFAPLGFLAAAVLADADPAEAKTLELKDLSRNTVASACARAGGTAYDIRNEASPYGCISARGSVTCDVNANCWGYVSDLRPMPSNSIDAILDSVKRGPSRIRPADLRIGR